MDCQNIKKLIPIYIDGESSPQENKFVKNHLAGCSACQNEFQALEKSWALLGELEGTEPQPGFVGRFWTNLALEQSWQEKAWRQIKRVLPSQPLVPALVATCVMVIVGFFVLQNYLQISGTDQMLVQLSDDEWAMVEDIELVENFELIEDIEFFEDLNLISNLDALET